MQTALFNVQGMTCGHCVKAIEAKVRSLPGIDTVTVDLQRAVAKIAYEPQAVTVDTIIKAINEEGYQASLDARH